MTQRTWSGATGSYTDPSQWSPTGVPTSGDIATINAGTVSASGIGLTSVTVNLNGTASAAGTLVLNADTIDAASLLTISDGGSFGGTVAPTLTFQGTTTNSGVINFTGTTPAVTFAAGAALVNAGSITIAGSSPQIQTASGASAGSIVNNGMIQVTNPSDAYQAAIVNAAISGTGTISLGNYAAVSFRSSISSGQTVAFNNSPSANSAFEVDSPTAFGATISGFVSSDRLILTSIPYTNYTYASTGSSSGVLTLYSGSTVESQVKLSGIYAQGEFNVQANPLGTSGLNNVIVTTSVTDSTTGTTAIGAVYRFFDNTNGTHFFTSDIGERNTVLSSLSSRYIEETNNFGTVAQTDPNETAVYRFFDKVYGTHFFTASAGERDGLIATRSDTLTYEPNSTFYEHATQQTGDVAVYRFFDTQYGTHFYTGSSSEYAGLTTPGTPTYRSNLTYEGVGFYAPAGTYT